LRGPRDRPISRRLGGRPCRLQTRSLPKGARGRPRWHRQLPIPKGTRDIPRRPRECSTHDPSQPILGAWRAQPWIRRTACRPAAPPRRSGLPSRPGEGSGASTRAVRRRPSPSLMSVLLKDHQAARPRLSRLLRPAGRPCSPSRPGPLGLVARPPDPPRSMTGLLARQPPARMNPLEPVAPRARTARLARTPRPGVSRVWFSGVPLRRQVGSAAPVRVRPGLWVGPAAPVRVRLRRQVGRAGLGLLVVRIRLVGVLLGRPAGLVGVWVVRVRPALWSLDPVGHRPPSSRRAVPGGSRPTPGLVGPAGPSLSI